MSAYCNAGRHLFNGPQPVLQWPGGKSTLDSNKYTHGLRQLVADMLCPNAGLRPSAQRVNDETFKDNRQRN